MSGKTLLLLTDNASIDRNDLKYRFYLQVTISIIAVKKYILPHIAIYLQNFKQDELLQFTNWLNDTYHLQLKLADRPDGEGYYIRTTKVEATFNFLKQIEKVALTYPNGSYKTNWTYRGHIEKIRLQKKYPTYEILLSSQERMKPYSEAEIEIMIAMENAKQTDQAIADALQRTYWSVVYKIRELRKQKQL